MPGGDEKVRHPLFARLYARLSAQAEDKGQAEHRRELLSGLEGRAIEVGAGHGLNFPYYPETVTEVVAVEPESHLRRMASKAAEEARVPVVVVDGVAGSIPAGDGEFDAAVACLVLCSVPDPARALAEFHRVLRPGGELRFYEHVLADTPALARAQRIGDRTRAWPLVAGGCHASRDTARTMEMAGFTIERCKRFPFRAELVEFLATPKILGVARRA
jgi:ubiquinone/menaquinone biosynthesis C-methylase UbiE